MTALKRGVTFKNDNSGQEYRIPTLYEWTFVGAYVYQGILDGSANYKNGLTEMVPLEYPNSNNNISVTSYYDVVGTWTSYYTNFTQVVYAIKFEEETITHNAYRCAYRYRQEVGGTISGNSTNVSTGYWIIDVVYIGDDTNIDINYIENADNSSMWDNPDATLIIPAVAEGHSHYHSSTCTNSSNPTWNQSVVWNLGGHFYTGIYGSWCYNPSNTYFHVRLIEKH